MRKSSAAAEKLAIAEPEKPAPDVSSKIGDDIEAQIRRLRQVLTLMAPETGSVALGSSRRATSHVPITERVRLLTEYRR
jgi:hypothetical protein